MTTNAISERDAVDPARCWNGALLDLDAYLARIGHAGSLAPTPETLRALHRAHVAAIPFENLDIALGRPVAVDLESIQDKLVRRPRGGYCYEQNLLLAAVLERLGYSVTGLAARIRMGSDRLRPTTHALLMAEARDGAWLADVGFGGEGLLEPIALSDGGEARQGDWRFRLDRTAAEEWVLRSLHADGWFDLHAFTLAPWYSVDYAVVNHYTSTHPRSPFVGRIAVQRTGADARHTLTGTELTTAHPDGRSESRNLAAEALPETLRDVFGISLDADDEAALVRRARR
ncbi:N-hydroxyarylamine O-acetyltransferase [Spinactinospora alkalitolerans]|uniref:N-hydroxyarylamine O-acetyltransferase n=1 Tax=Spinactinospora alkalitolerans TaxID=687207 RepID=A0A852TNS9_9ACTN|nr:arylamine N-acetyltransferase [Spinactinospora alkalitolerans]NYE45255.1 N-hydroxyarylamine O-acetyltransferase [Spinactinospora alkalitolerans]